MAAYVRDPSGRWTPREVTPQPSTPKKPDAGPLETAQPSDSTPDARKPPWCSPREPPTPQQAEKEKQRNWGRSYWDAALHKAAPARRLSKVYGGAAAAPEGAGAAKAGQQPQRPKKELGRMINMWETKTAESSGGEGLDSGGRPSSDGYDLEAAAEGPPVQEVVSTPRQADAAGGPPPTPPCKGPAASDGKPGRPASTPFLSTAPQLPPTTAEAPQPPSAQESPWPSAPSTPRLRPPELRWPAEPRGSRVVWCSCGARKWALELVRDEEQPAEEAAGGLLGWSSWFGSWLDPVSWLGWESPEPAGRGSRPAAAPQGWGQGRGDDLLLRV